MHKFARLALVLLGSATGAFPLQYSSAGTEHADGREFNVVDATGADDFRCRLHVDAATGLPAMLAWDEERPVVVSSSSIVEVRGGEVQVSSPTGGTVMPYPGPAGFGQKRWILSSFRMRDGVSWPRRIEVQFEGVSEDIRLDSIRINPKIDARRFDVR